MLQGSKTTFPPRGSKLCSRSLFKKRLVWRILLDSFPIFSTLSRVSARNSTTKPGRSCFFPASRSLWRPFRTWRTRINKWWWAFKVFTVVYRSLSISSSVYLTILKNSRTSTILLVLLNNRLSILSWVYISLIWKYLPSEAVKYLPDQDFPHCQPFPTKLPYQLTYPHLLPIDLFSPCAC